MKTSNATTFLLEPAEIAKLTGCYGGTKGKTRSVRQISQLLKMKIPYFVNAAGRPVVVRAIIEGGTTTSTPSTPAPSWEPGI